MTKGILVEEEQATTIELQHINVKLLLENPEQLELNSVVNVFHSWIQEQVCDELLLDVADYRHVHHGPGIVLIGHEADYSIDTADGRAGIRYNRKARLDGSNVDRLKQATGAALEAAQRLQRDPRLEGTCSIHGGEVEIVVNDRAATPNSPEMRSALDPEFRRFLNTLFGGTAYSVVYETDPRRLFGVGINADRPVAISDLLSNLGTFERSSQGIA